MLDRQIPHNPIGGIPTAVIGEADLINLMREDTMLFRDGNLQTPRNVFDTNGQAISMFATDEEYAASVRSADLIHADGQFIVWMSKLNQNAKIPERTATTDLIHAAADAAQKHGIKFFLLGGSEEINEACAEILKQMYPGLQIVGRRNGYFTQSEEIDVIDDINESGAEVVWVGLGKPKEQIFCQRVKSQLNCAWLVTCGGCFHFVVGDYKHAPEWMQKSGLEWVHRMATGPKYLWRRYLITIPHAIWLVIKHRLFPRKSEGSNG